MAVVLQKRFSIRIPGRGAHLVTDKILSELGSLPDSGILYLHCLHTSAGICLNENADPSVRRDLESFLNHLVPENWPHFTHTYEGPDDMPAHVKTALVGSSISIPVEAGSLVLGTWQGIYLLEFRDRFYSRNLYATIIT